MEKAFTLLVLICFQFLGFAQTGSIKGKVASNGKPVGGANVVIDKTKTGTAVKNDGSFELDNLKEGTYNLVISAVGYEPIKQSITVKQGRSSEIIAELTEAYSIIDDVVVTGTLKPVSRSESPIPVEVFTPKFFQKNPTPNLFEAVGMINGVRPQMNCNVCNTGDIHINGMEGPYTLILIDGMPIVSALSTVYGLSGIPNSMVERIEVVKGPAASLYGSEAMGGIINVITKTPAKAPALSIDMYGTTWKEYNVDAAVKFKAGKAQNLLGVNYYNFQNRLDKNHDNFTDITLQNRFSIFNKVSFDRKENRVASLGIRYVNEDRNGGEMKWTKQWRGSDSIYGESIYTQRMELIGAYQLPFKEKIMAQFSYNWHDQNSYYGTTSYNAYQAVSFAQVYWDKSLGAQHDFLLGASFRHTYYDDNTPATQNNDVTNPKNNPAKTSLPGMFIQDEWKINNQNTLLTGYRYDHDKTHGNIHSPRIAYKWSPNKNNTFRASFGTGFRVVNLFTEDHAALTGARQVVVEEELKPEKSFNSNLNYVVKIPSEKFFINLDVTAFYSYFTNKIVADYTSDPNKIIYDNLKGYALSKGISLNADVAFQFPLKVLAGVTYLDVYQVEEDAQGSGKLAKNTQFFAPKWSGNYLISYTLPAKFTIDLTGNFNGPMRLPLQINDYRPEYSPWFTLANIQITKKFNSLEIYGGAKNIFNFVPKYSLMRSFDPFDKTASDLVSNPNGYTFDTEYNYAPIQGIRGFVGVRYNLFK